MEWNVLITIEIQCKPSMVKIKVDIEMKFQHWLIKDNEIKCGQPNNVVISQHIKYKLKRNLMTLSNTYMEI